jgi:NADH:ubiquinone oxidoreductase subunit 6 (subunit J)
LLVQTFFVFYAVMRAPNHPADQTKTVGRTLDLGSAMYSQYLLPVEIVGVLLLMAIIGAVILVRRLSQPQLELVIEHELEQEHRKR